jgi:hypothetical protein
LESQQLLNLEEEPEEEATTAAEKCVPLLLSLKDLHPLPTVDPVIPNEQWRKVVYKLVWTGCLLSSTGKRPLIYISFIQGHVSRETLP